MKLWSWPGKLLLTNLDMPPGVRMRLETSWAGGFLPATQTQPALQDVALHDHCHAMQDVGLGWLSLVTRDIAHHAVAIRSGAVGP